MVSFHSSHVFIVRGLTAIATFMINSESSFFEMLGSMPGFRWISKSLTVKLVNPSMVQLLSGFFYLVPPLMYRGRVNLRCHIGRNMKHTLLLYFFSLGRQGRRLVFGIKRHASPLPPSLPNAHVWLSPT